jgi:hypothetical protein
LRDWRCIEIRARRAFRTRKEPLGKRKNPRGTYGRKGDAEKFTIHDFPEKNHGKAAPEGVDDLTHDEAGVSIGVSHETAELAVASIYRWWNGRMRVVRDQAKMPARLDRNVVESRQQLNYSESDGKPMGEPGLYVSRSVRFRDDFSTPR